jgi:hypothetical protein
MASSETPFQNRLRARYGQCNPVVQPLLIWDRRTDCSMSTRGPRALRRETSCGESIHHNLDRCCAGHRRTWRALVRGRKRRQFAGVDAVIGEHHPSTYRPILPDVWGQRFLSRTLQSSLRIFRVPSNLCSSKTFRICSKPLKKLLVDIMQTYQAGIKLFHAPRPEFGDIISLVP